MTSHDRNQIIRSALFTAVYTTEFKNKLEKHKRKGVPVSLPHPSWSLDSDRWWLNQTTIMKRREVMASIMLDNERKRKLELMLELMKMEQRERLFQPNRDEWGRFAPREDQEKVTSYESVLDEYDDPYLQ